MQCTSADLNHVKGFSDQHEQLLQFARRLKSSCYVLINLITF